MERNIELERHIVKSLSVVKYQLEATAKNGEKWQSPTITAEQVGNESAFIDYCKNKHFKHPNFRNAKSIKIVKIYDYMNGQHIEKETIYQEERKPQ